MLAEAASCDSVEAFVYTSSVDVYADPPHETVDENHPLWSSTAKTNEYNRTKAIGDRLVLDANGPRLRTVCLRLAHVYGDRHTQGLIEILDAIKGNAPLVQVGEGRNLMEVLSAHNAATAHLLAATALLRPDTTPASPKIDGEAFNISDGSPVPFWHHVRIMWKAARGEDALKGVKILPAWVMAALVFLAEWCYWIFTLGTLEPPAALSRTSLTYVTATHTYSITKGPRGTELRSRRGP